MATTVNMHQAKSNLSKLVEAVEAGSEAEIIIARNGTPAAKLVPVNTRRLRPLGLYDGVYPDISLEEFNADDEEIADLMINGPLFPEEPQPKITKRKRR
jgi:prevent-host-death family protein